MSDEPIVATKDRPGSYDAIETAKPGEPLFPIQGGDPFAYKTVMFWAKLCRTAGIKERNPQIADRLLRKATDAEFVAWKMKDYQRGEAQIEGRRASYAGIDLGSDEGRTEREALIRGAAKLHNALAGADEVAAVLAKMRVHPEQEVRVREAVAMLREAALSIEPRRGTERS